MRLERGERLGGSHVGDEPHVNFRDGTSRQNCLAAGSSVAADQAFDIHGWSRGEQLERFFPAHIVNPMLDAEQLLGFGFVLRGEILF